MTMISNEVLRIQPNRDKCVIRTTWGDTEVDMWAMAELAIWKASDNMDWEETQDLLKQLDNIKDKTKRLALR
jgi:hypothetical protein|tara:strand:- start:944 stop:1159 length:216 start_codon:yes stop_codon:yes gene_type:complete